MIESCFAVRFVVSAWTELQVQISNLKTEEKASENQSAADLTSIYFFSSYFFSLLYSCVHLLLLLPLSSG